MTLLIACLLIHLMGLSWWWYMAASVVWIGHLAFHTLGD